MELFSALITVVLLILVPGLAYGQSPASILKAAAAGRTDARGGAARWDRCAFGSGIYLGDHGQRLAMDPESCLLQLLQEARHIDSRALVRHRLRSAPSRDDVRCQVSWAAPPVYKCVHGRHP